MKVELTKELLIEEKIKNKMTIGEIAIKYGCSDYIIRNRLKKFNIKSNSRRKKPGDLTGKKIGYLIVLSKIEGKKQSPSGRCHTMWKCECQLDGNIVEIKQDALANGHTTSCGCRRYAKGAKSWNWAGYEEISSNNFTKIKKLAENKGYDFDLTIEYLWELFLKQNRQCAISGEIIFFATSVQHSAVTQTASLDRIDSSKGYIRENVQWVHKFINRMKSDLEESDFIYYCHCISKYQKLLGNDKIEQLGIKSLPSYDHNGIKITK